MHLWLPESLGELPGRLLCSLHRDCCRLRSCSWKSPRSAGSWYYSLPWGAVTWYHSKVLREMQARGWKPGPSWFDPMFQGQGRKELDARFLEAEDVPASRWSRIFRAACPYGEDEDRRLLENWKILHKE